MLDTLARRHDIAAAPRQASRKPDPIDAHVGAMIRKHRAAAGVSQEALAQRLGLTFQQVQKYEKAINRVSASRLVHIARALGTRPAAFLPPTLPDGRMDTRRRPRADHLDRAVGEADPTRQCRH